MKEAIAACGSNDRVWVRDHVCADGARVVKKYCVLSRKAFVELLNGLNMKPCQWNWYEVIRQDRPARLHLDIEFEQQREWKEINKQELRERLVNAKVEEDKIDPLVDRYVALSLIEFTEEDARYMYRWWRRALSKFLAEQGLSKVSVMNNKCVPRDMPRNERSPLEIQFRT